MAERSHLSAGLLPVPDTYGLWALSIRNIVSAGGRSGRRHRRSFEMLGVTLACLMTFSGLHLFMLRLGTASDFGLWNLPMGLGFGMLLGYGLGYLPVILAVCVFVPLVGGSGPAFSTALLDGSAQILVLALGVVIVRWLSGGRARDLAERRTFIAFMVVVPAVAILGSAARFITDFAMSASRDGIIPFTELVAGSFWGDVAGILLIGPFAMMSHRHLTSRPAGRTLASRNDRSEPSGAAWSYAGRAGLVGATFAGSLYVISILPSIAEMWLFGVISVPLIAGAWAFGLWGVAPVLVGLGLASLAKFEFGIEPAFPMQFAVVAAAANASVLGLFVTEQRRHKVTMNRQAALLDSVSFATEQLLGMTDQEKNVTEVLRHLAQEADLDRVYVLENRRNARDGEFPVLYELGSDFGQEQQDAVSALRGRHIRRSAELLEQGHALELTARDLSSDDEAVLRNSGTERTLILPVFADGRWWGCLGMDQGSDVGGWSRPDVATFEATARVLGALLAHTNVEQQFRQFTGSIPVVFWIASPDVLHKTYVSPAYEQIWGRPRDGIRENPRSWMAAIYHDDYARMSELLEGNPQAEYAEEYRIIRGDRSVRWIRDTGFAVVDASGQVNRIVGIAQDITPQKEAEERLRASEEQIRTSLSEKEVLLKEIHHRVKNNLQVISSLLSLQAGKIRDNDAAQVFRDSQYRVRAMALVHERLYQSEDLARIDFAGYVQDMTGHLLRSYQGGSRGIQLKADVRGVSLDVDTAIPCALIINELVSNALKYAFQEGQSGEIRVCLSKVDDSIVMTISDDGIGLPEGTSFETSESLGLQLVHSLTDQLGGTVACTTDSGTQFEIRFPSMDGGS